MLACFKKSIEYTVWEIILDETSKSDNCLCRVAFHYSNNEYIHIKQFIYCIQISEGNKSIDSEYLHYLSNALTNRTVLAKKIFD